MASTHTVGTATIGWNSDMKAMSHRDLMMEAGLVVMVTWRTSLPSMALVWVIRASRRVAAARSRCCCPSCRPGRRERDRPAPVETAGGGQHLVVAVARCDERGGGERERPAPVVTAVGTVRHAHSSHGGDHAPIKAVAGDRGRCRTWRMAWQCQ